MNLLKKTYLLILLTFFVASGENFAQTLKEKVDGLVSKYNDYELFNGSILVANNSGVIIEKGYGPANIEWNIANTPDTRFRLGSVTKQFTSMLIMQLVKNGKVKLDAKVTDYLPYYRHDTGSKVTIEMLLTHTSGIPSYTSAPDFGKTSILHYEPDEFIKQHCSGNLEFEPGSRYLYNNSGYFILGAIIEHVTGMRYEDALHKFILDPLGLKNTGYDHFQTIIPQRATGYDKTFIDYQNSAYLDMSLPYAAGSMYSTVGDIYKWDKSLQTEKLLPADFMKMIFEPRVATGKQFYGFGWTIGKLKIGEDSVTTISHNGGINGFVTRNFMIPEKNIFVILLNNTSGAPLNDICGQIINILTNQEFDYPKKPANNHIVLYKEIKSKGIHAALSDYIEKKNNDDSQKISEAWMNSLGYQLMKENLLEEALAVFKLNVAEHPESYNVYDSYGEALLKQGDKKNAAANYKKSVELNPGNQNGIEVLKELGVNPGIKTDLKLSPKILKSYAGNYQLAPNFFIEVSVNEDRIFAQGTGQPKNEIFPKNETRFYLKVVNAEIEFQKDKNGEVTGFTLYQNNRQMPAKKVK